jgi:hypothetical protein
MHHASHAEFCTLQQAARAKFKAQFDAWSDNSSKWGWVLKSAMANPEEKAAARAWLAAHKEKNR